MKKLIGVLVILSFWIIACNSPEPPPEAQVSPSLTIEKPPSATPQPPTATSTLFLTPTNLPTETPTATASPVPTLAPISLQNAADLNVIRSVGLEKFQDMAWSPSGAYFAYADGNQLVVFDGVSLGLVAELGVKNEFDVSEEIYAILFLDDQHVLFATALAGSGVRVFDVPSGEVTETWPFAPDQNGLYRDLDISPNGEWLAITYDWFLGTGPGEGVVDSFVDIWNVQTQKKIVSLGNGLGYMPEVAFSPDGKWLGMWGDATGLTLLEPPTFKEASAEQSIGSANSFTFHPDGTQISIVNKQSLYVLDLQTGEMSVAAKFTGNAQKMIFSPENSAVFMVAEMSGEVTFFELGNDQPVSRDFGITSDFRDFTLHPSGKILALADERGLYFIGTGGELPTPTPRPPTDTPPPTETPTPFPTPTPRPTGTPISVAQAISDGNIPLITAENADKLQHVANFVLGRAVSQVSWSPDGTKLIFTYPSSDSSAGVEIYTFSYASGLQNTQNIPAWDTNSFAISLDGSKIVKQNTLGQFEIFDTLTNELLQVVGEPVNNPLGASLAWSPQMDVLATMFFVPGGSVPEIRLFDLKTTQSAGAYAREDILQTEGLTFSPGGSLLATTSGLDGNTYVWNRNTGKIALALYGEQPAFSPDGQMIATRGAEGVSIYSVADGSLLMSLNAPATASFAGTTFSPDSTLLVTTGNALRLWSLPDGTFAAEYEAQEPYTHAAFSPDGKLLLTVRGEGASTRILIWAVLP